MNAERLLQHFDRISEAPDAIPRLRRFILELAVRGKLVEQDPNDELAAGLLKRIQAEKGRLVKEGKIRAPRAMELSEDDKELFYLPANWQWCRLAEVGAIVGGGTPPSGDQDNFTKGGTGIAWLTPADLGKHGGLYISHGARDLTEKGLKASSATLMPEGSVLFTSRAPIGYTAIAVNEISTNQGFKSVVPYVRDCSRFIAIYFQAFAPWIDGKASGTTFREVSGKIVASLPFPLPPLAEQHRIVAKVDELMALCDQLEAAKTEREQSRDRLVAASLHRLNSPADTAETDATDLPAWQADAFRDHARFTFSHLPRLTTRPEHIKQLRQTIINLAVRGKLVPQDPNDETALELLKQIGTEKKKLAQRRKSAKEDNQVIEETGVSFEIPNGWCWVRLDEISMSFRYGTSVKCSYEHIGEPVLRIPNVDNGRINTSDLKFGSLSQHEIDDLRLHAGDILMVRSNGSLDLVGRPALVEAHVFGFCYAGYLVRVRTNVNYIAPT